jgi:hypothetical protein
MGLRPPNADSSRVSLVPSEREQEMSHNSEHDREHVAVRKHIERRGADGLQGRVHVHSHRKWAHVLKQRAEMVPNHQDEGGWGRGRVSGANRTYSLYRRRFIVYNFIGTVGTVGLKSLGAQGTRAPPRHVGASPSPAVSRAALNTSERNTPPGKRKWETPSRKKHYYA